jgi:uridine kinase
MEALRKTYDKVVAYVEQNLRDILAICIAGQAVKNKKLTQGELKTIEHELRSNENKINRYKNDLRKTAESSIQKNDAFTDLDINSELTAIERFTELKGSKTDVFSPTTKPGA